MLWSHKRPLSRVPRVEGFVDVDNLLIQERRPYTPPAHFGGYMDTTWMAWLLRHLLTILETIGEEASLTLFVNLHSQHENAHRREILEAAQGLNIRVVHVNPDATGKDQVDAALAARWANKDAAVPLDVPFVLFSEDAGFATLIHVTRARGRRVFVFLPTNYFYPRHVEETDGWGWIDNDAYRNRALSFLLDPEAKQPTPHFLEKMEERFPEAALWWTDANRALQALDREPDRIFRNDQECLTFFTENGVDHERARTLIWFLVFYGVLRANTGGLQKDPGYQRRSLPLPSTV